MIYRAVCPSISIKHGLVKRRGKGRMVRFGCNRTYLLAGEKHSTCIHGKWDPSPPKCVRPTCKPITLLRSNDKVLIYPTHNGAVQHFFCKPGYFLNGPSDIYCDGYKWDNHAPTCLANNTKPKLSCDFEEEDLCGWTHDLNHDFDWRRENYGTPSGSIGTGPAFDHTKGVAGDGYYMYIESSARNENDTARLISPIYERMDQTEVCLEFYYHMFGSTIGTLRVYLKKSKDTWTLDPDLAVFSESGNQGDKWYRAYQHLGVIDDDFQIIFEGVRGSGYVSDMAIDDVKIITDCPDDSGYSTESESPNTYIIPTVDSCENRCGQMDGANNDNLHITCDCDDDCSYRSRCCPDYYDFCFSGSDSTFSYEETATEISNVTDMIEDTSTETYYSTTDTSETTMDARMTFPASKRIVFSSSPVPNRYFTRPARTSTSNNVTLTTTTQNMLIPKFTRPIIYVRPPPPTMKVIRKVITKYPTKKPTTPPMIYNNPQPTMSRKEIDSDAIDVPQPTHNDEGLLLTQLPEDNGENSKEFWSNENENSVDSPFFRTNIGESGKLLFSQKESDSSNTNIFVIVISVIGTVVFISIAVFAVFWKYRRPGRRMHFSNGESQSDVRFLTSDEIIDFSLSDCYDE